MIYATCPICDFKFEVEDFIPDEPDGIFGFSTHGDEGNCPKCNAHYVIDEDCNDPIDAILIADFDFYHLSYEEKQKVITDYKNKTTA